MSGAAFSSVSVESQGLASVVSLAKALPKWKCEFLNQACSDQASQYIHCTFSNGLSFQKRASFRPSGAGMAKVISGCPSHIWWSHIKTWNLYGFIYRRFSKLKFLDARNLNLNHATYVFWHSYLLMITSCCVRWLTEDLAKYTLNHVTLLF